jgi:hypothetical protein
MSTLWFGKDWSLSLYRPVCWTAIFRIDLQLLSKSIDLVNVMFTEAEIELSKCFIKISNKIHHLVDFSKFSDTLLTQASHK